MRSDEIISKGFILMIYKIIYFNKTKFYRKNTQFLIKFSFSQIVEKASNASSSLIEFVLFILFSL